MAKRSASELLITPDSIDLSSLDDPLVTKTNVTTNVITTTALTDQFIIQFRRGQTLLDANSFLLLLNPASKPNVVCKLVRCLQDGSSQHVLSMMITNDSPGHMSKCAIKCSLLEENENKMEMEKSKRVKLEHDVTVSQFIVDFKQLSNILKNVDRQQPTIIRRNGHTFTVEYEIKNQLFDVDFHEVVADDIPWFIPPVTYQYEGSIVTQRLKKYFDQAGPIENSVVIVRVYNHGTTTVVKIELDNKDAAENKQKCQTLIGTRATPMEAEPELESETQDGDNHESFKDICNDQNNLIMIAAFNKREMMNLSKINTESINIKLGMNPNRLQEAIDPNTGRIILGDDGKPRMLPSFSIPGLFTYNTSEVELSIYLVQIECPALEGEIEFVREKLQKLQR